MSFNIPQVEKYDFYLDVAFSKARKAANQKKSVLKGDRLMKAKTIEIEKLGVINKELASKFQLIVTSFPSFDGLTEFYNELVRALIDYKELKKSLGAMNWAKKKVDEFSSQFRTKIIRCNDIDTIKTYGKQYYGRISSVLKQVKNNLAYLDEVRKILRTFPSIKDGLFTVAIAGFPNIGKSTLLAKLTTSKPDIQPYAFTTKGLNVGYWKEGTMKLQFIDTPGTLNRLDKMNEIETIAYLAIKYCAHAMIYIYDLTETYSIKDQKKLFKRLVEFDRPIIIYLSKTDILPKDVVADFKKKIEVIDDVEVLKERILEEYKKYRDLE